MAAIILWGDYLIKQFEIEPDFMELEKTSLKNDECSYYSVMLLNIIYSEVGDKDKLNQLNEKAKTIADHNFSIQKFLCGDSYSHQTGMDISEKIHYCEAALSNNEKPNFLSLNEFKRQKEVIYDSLREAYYETKDIDKLNGICEKRQSQWRKSSCYSYLELLADNSCSNINICKNIINHWKNLYSKTQFIKDKAKEHKEAANKLISLYFKIKQSKKLIDLCTEIKYSDIDNPKIRHDCYFREYELGETFYELKQYSAAFNLYEAASEDNNFWGSQAKIKLGDMYCEGLGIEKNYYRAIGFYKSALENNNLSKDERSRVTGNTGVTYTRLKDYRMAFKYYLDAAMQGDSFFQGYVARSYLSGTGVIEDPMEAYAWLSVALTQSIEDKEKQQSSEKIKKLLESMFIQEDPSGKKLNKARVLAKKYYELYVVKKTD